MPSPSFLLLSLLSLLLLLLLSLPPGAVSIPKYGYSMVVTMICRDEDVNLRANLPIWEEIGDYFVFLMDTRNSDNSTATIARVLGNKDRYVILPNEFDGFGSSRTRSLEAAWKHYPQASHVWIADPDWKPDLSTIQFNELDNTHDVFAFLSYDRNGATTRNMHWLLRHREGLKMRYNLHEVLDIGSAYTWAKTGWVIHEIEQAGSWHTTVGHGHSMSKKRFEFDLKWLYKDLEEYGHDPHTHYYLGVTEEAFASETMKETGLSNIVIEHALQAVKYLKLRIHGTYKDEFVEERWGCMVVLGQIYQSILFDFQEASRWFGMCYEYDRSKIYCRLLQLQLFVNHGLFPESIDLTHKLLKMEKSNRTMLNYFKQFDCDLPNVAADILGSSILYGGDTAANNELLAMYVVLLKQMVEENPKICAGVSTGLKPDHRAAIESILRNTHYSIHSSTQVLCQNPNFANYLYMNKFTVHPCESAIQSIKQEKICSIYLSNFPPISDDVQVSTFGEFIGAASISDVIQHVYFGDESVVSSQGVYRILFGHFFNLKNVIATLVDASRRPSVNFHITVVSPFSQLRNSLFEQNAICRYSMPKNVKIEFLVEAFSDFLARDNVGPFDYIEFNGGLSFDTNREKTLESLHKKLSPIGVLGVSYVTKNFVEHSIRAAIADRNELSHPPFSAQRNYLVRTILENKKFGKLAKDPQVMQFFGASADDDNFDEFYGKLHKQLTTELPIGESFYEADVLSLLESTGFKAHATFPIVSHYEASESFEANLFKSVGVPEYLFARDFLVNFRKSVYVTRNDAQVLGRASANRIMGNYGIGDANDDVIVLDRLGGMSIYFKVVSDRGAALMSTKLSFAQMYGDSNMSTSLVIMPIVAPIFQIISNKPTIKDLVLFCIKSAGGAVDEKVVRIHLFNVLDSLEKLNYIAFQHPTFGQVIDLDSNEPYPREISSTPAKARYSTESSIPANKQKTPISKSSDSAFESSLLEKAAKMRAMGFPERMVNEALEAERAKAGKSQPATTASSSTHTATTTSTPSTSTPRSSGSSSSNNDSAFEKSLQEKAAKMRAMGFPERMVNEALDAERAKAGKASQSTQTASKSAASRSSSPASPISTSTATTSDGDFEKSLQEKAAKMRAMGFPERMINEALDAERAKAGKSQSTVSSMSTKVASPASTGKSPTSSATNSNDEFEKSLQEKAAKMRAMGFPERMVNEAIEAERAKAASSSGPAVKKSQPESAVSKDDLEKTLKEKAARMRAMGFPESKVTEAIEAERAKAAKTPASSTSQPSTSASSASDNDFEKSLQEKAAKMRAMGFPERMVNEALEAERAKAGKSQSAATASSQASSQSASTPKPGSSNAASSASSSNSDSAFEKSLQEKAAKMRAMGFPERMVNEALDAERAKAGKASQSTQTASSTPAAASAVHSTSTSSASSSTASSLDGDFEKSLKEKAAKMRAMGFPERMVNEALEAERAKAGKSQPAAAASQASASSASSNVDSKQSESDEKIEGILKEKATKMRAMGFPERMVNEALEAERQKLLGKTDNQKPASSSASTSGAAAAKAPVKSSTTAKSADDSKSKIKQLFENLKGTPDSSAGKTENDKSVKNSAKGQDNFITEKRTVLTEKDKANATLIYEAASRISGSENVQTEAALMNSFRSLNCMHTLITGGDNSAVDACKYPNSLQRKSAALDIISLKKLQFDINQLKYIVSTVKNTDDTANLVEIVISSLEKASTELRKSTLDSNEIVKLSPAQLEAYLYSIGHLFHLQSVRELPTQQYMTYPEAILQVQMAARSLSTDSDFVVVDVVAQRNTLNRISKFLLQSTVWFDITNGQAFASHFNDGLVLPDISKLATEVAAACSDKGQLLKVKSFFAVAVDSSEGASTPIIMAKADELYAVLWVSPGGADESDSEVDGIKIFDPNTVTVLYSKGFSLYQNIHGNFLSSRGSLAIDTDKECAKANYEVIPRLQNRIVLINSRVPFVITSKTTRKKAKADFAERTQMALVFQLTSK